MASYNHVCEDCGNEWMSAKERQTCPRCGSASTQSNVSRGSQIFRYEFCVNSIVFKFCR
jgi:rRNA maturation endonuclease Nob1